MKNKYKILSIILISLLLITALGIGFMVTKDYYFQKGGEAGYNYAVLSAVQDLNEKGYTGITIGNQTVILVPYTEKNTNGTNERKKQN